LRQVGTANVGSINRAWEEAGNDDTISESLVNKARSRLKLTNPKFGRKKPSGGGAAPSAKGRPKRAKVTESLANGVASTTASSGHTRASHRPERVVDEVEAGIDDLIFTLKANGGMPEVEEALRAARRVLTRRNGG
jgi:hypothetical protein